MNILIYNKKKLIRYLKTDMYDIGIK